MKFDFNTKIDRRGTHSLKWDWMEENCGVSPDDGIPLWVADMEFPPPPAVQEAFQAAVDHGVHGYFGDNTAYLKAVQGWMDRRHDWKIETDWIMNVHGVVMAVNLLVQTFCRPGDGVVIQSPVYYPFFSAVRNNGCHVVNNPLRRSGAHYEMDFDDLAKKVDANTRMLILCSPHNPGGRVWRREELERVAEFCLSRDILIVCDEIHHDLVYEGSAHTVLAGMEPELAGRVITCTAATKTFNLAGTMTGNVIIADEKLRAEFRRQLYRCGVSLPNAFGPLAATAAYSHGDEWLDALLRHLQSNRDMVDAAVAAIPGVRSMPLEATYLSWLDFSDTGLPMKEVSRRVAEDARLALNQGHTFGPGGESCLRLNFACGRPMLETALERLVSVFPAQD